MDDVTLTYNPAPFINGFNKIVKGLDTLNEKFNAMDKNAEKRTQKVSASFFQISKAVLAASVIMDLMKRGVARIAENIPELGASFKIAGDVISKNLLWPLRKELAPLLQRMLNWVRDHRAMFLQWGGVIVNIFRVIKGVVVGLWNSLKTFWQSFTAGIKNSMGFTIKSISDLVNLALFKIAVVFAYLTAMLQSIATPLGTLFATLINGVHAFTSGFMEGIGNITGIFGNFMGLIKDVIGIFNSVGTDNGFLTLLNNIGKIIGWLVGTGLDMLITGVRNAIKGFQMLFDVVGIIKSKVTGDQSAYNRNVQDLQRHQNEYADINAQTDTRQSNRNRVLGTVFNSQSTSNSPTVNNNNQKIEIHVNGAQSPKSTAQEIKNILALSR